MTTSKWRAVTTDSIHRAEVRDDADERIADVYCGAAPDLLAALGGVSPHLRPIGGLPCYCMQKPHSAACERARATIAKARGGQ